MPERAHEQLDLAPHRDAARLRGGQQGTGAGVQRRQARADRHQADIIEQAFRERAAHEPGRSQLGLQEDKVGGRLARVGHTHRAAVQATPARHGQPRFAEAKYQHMRFLQLAKHFDFLPLVSCIYIESAVSP
ncbi:hypothetical protein D3C72_1502720 [compost metagenome]